RSAARDGQAGRSRADDRLGARGGLGEGEPAGDSRRVVSRTAWRQRGRGHFVWRCQSLGPPAGDVLQGGRETTAVRGLHDGGQNVSLLQRRAALSLRTRLVVHAVPVLGPEARSLAGEGE